MNNIENHARRAQAYLEGKDPNVQKTFFITASQVMLFASLITSIIKAINDCTSSEEQALKVARRPNRLQRGMLKRITRRKVGWFKYYFSGKDYVGAVEKAGKDLSTEEMRGLLDEADNK